MKRKSIPDSVKRAIWRSPCAICERKDDIEVDHIVPVCQGGTSERANLQPLCRVCNILKRTLGTNEAVLAWSKEFEREFRRRQWLRTERAARILQGEWF